MVTIILPRDGENWADMVIADKEMLETETNYYGKIECVWNPDKQLHSIACFIFPQTSF